MGNGIDTANLTQNDLACRAAKGDIESFNLLYQNHWRRVYSLCLRILKDPILAEDLSQETWLQVHRKLKTFRGDAAFTTWLHRVTFNLVMMHLRKKKLPIGDFFITTDEDGEPTETDFVDSQTEKIEDILIYKLDLDKAISVLPPGYHNAINMHDVHGLTHSDISELIGHSVGNSKSQLHKARKVMRRALEGRGPLRKKVASFNSRPLNGHHGQDTLPKKFSNQFGIDLPEVDVEELFLAADEADWEE